MKVGDLVKCVHDDDVGIITDLYECKKSTVVTVGEWGMELLNAAS